MKLNNRQTSSLKKSRFWAIFSLLWIFLFFSGCAVASLVLGSMGKIRGIVSDARTKKHLSDVYVGAYNYYLEDSDYTDGDGFYQLTLESGTYDIYFEKEGYRSVTLRNIGVVSPFTRSLDVNLEPGNDDDDDDDEPISDNLLFVNQANADYFVAFELNTDNGRLEAYSSTPKRTGDDPRGILHIGKKARLYILNQSDNTVSVYNTSTAQFTPLDDSPFPLKASGGAPYFMVYDSYTDRIFISHYDKTGKGQVEAINVSDNNSVTSLGTVNIPSLAKDPRFMAVHPKKHVLFIASRNGNTITSYDIVNDEQMDSVQVEDPAFITLNSAKDRLYVIGGETRKITTIDVSDPDNMIKISTTTTITSDSDRQAYCCAFDIYNSRLFTLDGDSHGFTLRIWNAKGDQPYSQLESGISLGNSSAKYMYYDNSSEYLIISHDGADETGIRVFDCVGYPTGVKEVSHSPFAEGARFFMMDM